MSRLIVVLAAVALVAAAVWYAVTQLPRRSESQPQPTTEARVVQQPATAPPSASAGAPPLGVSCGGRCGTERWAVKTLSDPTRDQVELRPIATTVESLALLPMAPGGPFDRGGDAERHVFGVDAYLGGWRLERDHDYHMVLFGRGNQRLSLIAEIPDPACAGACQSGFADRYAEARAALEACLQLANPQGRPILAHVEGVGFFDRDHSQTGRAPNLIELHPVLRLRCGLE